ncbi:MAG: CHAT domain-containing protein, partial [Anaerosomatales bacterium]|nr:CHAT domain-containing protein [Anaerosomatales bacterium]
AAQTLAARLGGETRRLDGAPQPSLECALLLLYGHGTFDHRDPHASGIRYADGSGAVRRLAAADLARSGMRADVAIAAACESGRARASRGDALFGYRRALLGVSRCAVSTLWSVYEPATAGIVRALLNGMAEGSPAPDALRAAQLAAMSGQLEAIGYDPAHPFYWAGLVCAGEPIALVPETRG